MPLVDVYYRKSQFIFPGENYKRLKRLFQEEFVSAVIEALVVEADSKTHLTPSEIVVEPHCINDTLGYQVEDVVIKITANAYPTRLAVQSQSEELLNQKVKEILGADITAEGVWFTWALTNEQLLALSNQPPRTE